MVPFVYESRRPPMFEESVMGRAEAICLFIFKLCVAIMLLAAMAFPIMAWGQPPQAVSPPQSIFAPVEDKVEKRECPCGISGCECGCKDGKTCICFKKMVDGWKWDKGGKYWWRYKAEVIKPISPTIIWSRPAQPYYLPIQPTFSPPIYRSGPVGAGFSLGNGGFGGSCGPRG